MHGCMTEYVVCNHPRADGRIAVDIAFPIIICSSSTVKVVIMTHKEICTQSAIF